MDQGNHVDREAADGQAGGSRLVVACGARLRGADASVCMSRRMYKERV